MNTREFSLEFDALFNNINSGTSPGLNEYEKSVFLTKAQEEVVKLHLNPKGNRSGEGFSDSPKRNADLYTLIKTAGIALNTVALNDRMFANSSVFYAPKDMLYPISFRIQWTESGINKTRVVIQMRPDEVNRLLMKPYKYPFKGSGWVVYDNAGSTGASIFEVITRVSDNPVSSKSNYTLYVSYVKVPSPIILTDLTKFAEEMYGTTALTSLQIVSINGFTLESNGDMPVELHREILDTAISLAKIHYEGNSQLIVQHGMSNE